MHHTILLICPNIFFENLFLILSYKASLMINYVRNCVIMMIDPTKNISSNRGISLDIRQ